MFDIKAKTPIGANVIIIETIFIIQSFITLNASTTDLALSPMLPNDTPKNTANTNTCNKLPLDIDLTGLLGIMSKKMSTILLASGGT